jgi:DNA repair exonuclease SbcCD nuclease subunit
VVEVVVKIVVTGDNHLNYYSQKYGSKLEHRRAQMGRAWRETVDFAIDQSADLYLNVGDMFDQVTPRNPPRCRVVEAFVDLLEAGVKPFIIAGTHDSPATMTDGSSPHGVLKEAGLATVFEDTTRFGHEVIDIDGRRISIAGISTDKRLHPDMDPLESVKIPAEGDFNIAMLHYSVEKVAPPFWEEPQIRISSIEENKQIDLFTLGHIHKHIEHRVGDSLILYPGSTERVNFGESEAETGFCYLKVDGGNIDVEYVKTQSQPMSRINIHTSKIPAQRPTKHILEIVRESPNFR